MCRVVVVVVVTSRIKRDGLIAAIGHYSDFI